METIENLVISRSGKVTRKIRWDLYFSLGIYILGLFLTAYAAVLYQSHMYLKWVLPGGFFILIMLLIQNIVLIRNHKALKSLDINLRESVSGIIRYFRGSYRLWQLFYPMGIIILVFTVTLLVDYQDGLYRINHPLEFVIVMVVMYVFMYFPMRYTSNVYLKDLENCLQNLDEQEYLSIGSTIRRYRTFLIIFAVGLALLVLGSLVLWYISAGK